MNPPTTSMLKVPGASLYHEVRGAGTVLLLIPGGNGDAAPFEGIANALADRYRLVSYERRGFFRSPLDGPVDDEHRLETDSEDAHRLLRHLTDAPAHVFGSSSGAIVGLDLVARHSEQVRTLVAHEPPAVRLLPDAEQQLAFIDDVYDTYRASGLERAMAKFSAGMGLDAGPLPPQGAELPRPLAEMVSRLRSNLGFWLEHELRQYPRFEPDIAAIRAARTRLVLAGGRDSRESVPYRPNTVLAERLGSIVADFPGGHAGYATNPAEFAERLAEVLSF